MIDRSADSDLRSENEDLRRIVEEYRQRELRDLRERLAESQNAAAHYRQEAERNADTGRKISEESNKMISELKSKLQILETVKSSVRRGITS